MKKLVPTIALVILGFHFPFAFAQSISLDQNPWSANCSSADGPVTFFHKRGNSLVRQFYSNGSTVGQPMQFTDVRFLGGELWKLVGASSNTPEGMYLIIRFVSGTYRIIEFYDGRSLVVKDGVNTTTRNVTGEIKECLPGSAVHTRYRSEIASQSSVAQKATPEPVSKSVDPTLAKVTQRMSGLQISKCRSIGISLMVLGQVIKDKRAEQSGTRLMELFDQIAVAKHGSLEATRAFEKNNSEFRQLENEMSKKNFDGNYLNNEFESCQRALQVAMS